MSAMHPPQDRDHTRRGRLGAAPFAAAVGVAGGVAVLAERSDLPSPAGLAATGSVLVIGAAAVAAWRWARRRSERRMRAAVLRYLQHDGLAALMTDAEGRIEATNPAAAAVLPGAQGQGVATALEGLMDDPHAVVHRLRVALDADLPPREDVETRRGPMRLSATPLPGGGLLYRMEGRAVVPRAGADGGAGGGGLPTMTVSDRGTVLWVSAAMRAVLGHRPHHLSEVLPGGALGPPGAPQDLRCAEGVRRMRVFASPEGERRHVVVLPAEGDAPSGADVMESLPVAVIRLALDGTVVASNRMAKLLLPRVREAGAALGDMVEGLGRPVRDWVDEVAHGRTAHRTETGRATDSVPDLYLQITLARADGGLVAVLSDATELKTMEAQFVQSQKMQAIGQLAGGVAHDFNNLLTAIAGHCDLLLLRHGDGDESHDDLVQINRNAGRAAALVGQLLAFSRKQTLEMREVDLRDTLGELTHLLDRLVGDNVRLTLDHDEALVPIRGDRRQLEQVLMNLVVNARDAMPGGGEVALSTRYVTLDAPLQRDRATVPPGDYVVIAVADAGSGIPPERLGRIFEPFYTTKRPGEGTGLGLSMAYGIVKQSGGFIFADTEVGRGTTFSLYFPAVAGGPRPAPQPALKPAAGPAQGGAGRRVLLVEDEAPVRAFAARALRLRGYAVEEAGDAAAALDLLEDPDLPVDLIVTDVMMPGMDGPTWVRRALRDRPDLRTVFMSGYSEDALSDRRAAVPNSTFLPKPFSLSELTSTVQRALEG